MSSTEILRNDKTYVLAVWDGVRKGFDTTGDSTSRIPYEDTDGRQTHLHIPKLDLLKLVLEVNGKGGMEVTLRHNQS